MRHAVEHYFGGGSELLNMHERLADLLLIALSVSFEDAGKACTHVHTVQYMYNLCCREMLRML